MSQATISERPYVNSNLFSGHYLDERLQLRDEWECDDEAAEIMDELQSLYELEDRLVEGYNEDSLIDNWIDEVLDILGFGTQVETSLPETSGFVDILLYESEVTRRDAAGIFLDTQDATVCRSGPECSNPPPVSLQPSFLALDVLHTESSVKAMRPVHEVDIRWASSAMDSASASSSEPSMDTGWHGIMAVEWEGQAGPAVMDETSGWRGWMRGMAWMST